MTTRKKIGLGIGVGGLVVGILTALSDRSNCEPDDPFEGEDLNIGDGLDDDLKEDPPED